MVGLQIESKGGMKIGVSFVYFRAFDQSARHNNIILIVLQQN